MRRKNTPKKGQVVDVFDDIKNVIRKAKVISTPVDDEILGIMFEVQFIDKGMKGVAYWSQFKQNWSRMDIIGLSPATFSKEHIPEVIR
jgi:hypothetical protein